MPRLVSVQSSGCAPIVKAWEKKKSESVFWEKAQTLAFGITDNEKIAVHTQEFEQKACSDFALDRSLKSAEVLARIGYRYLSEPDFREKVQKDFK